MTPVEKLIRLGRKRDYNARRKEASKAGDEILPLNQRRTPLIRLPLKTQNKVASEQPKRRRRNQRKETLSERERSTPLKGKGKKKYKENDDEGGSKGMEETRPPSVVRVTSSVGQKEQMPPFVVRQSDQGPSSLRNPPASTGTFAEWLASAVEPSGQFDSTQKGKKKIEGEDKKARKKVYNRKYMDGLNARNESNLTGKKGKPLKFRNKEEQLAERRKTFKKKWEDMEEVEREDKRKADRAYQAERRVEKKKKLIASRAGGNFNGQPSDQTLDEVERLEKRGKVESSSETFGIDTFSPLSSWSVPYLAQERSPSLGLSIRIVSQSQPSSFKEMPYVLRFLSTHASLFPLCQVERIEIGQAKAKMGEVCRDTREDMFSGDGRTKGNTRSRGNGKDFKSSFSSPFSEDDDGESRLVKRGMESMTASFGPIVSPSASWNQVRSTLSSAQPVVLFSHEPETILDPGKMYVDQESIDSPKTRRARRATLLKESRNRMAAARSAKAREGRYHSASHHQSLARNNLKNADERVDFDLGLELSLQPASFTKYRKRKLLERGDKSEVDSRVAHNKSKKIYRENLKARHGPIRKWDKPVKYESYKECADARKARLHVWLTGMDPPVRKQFLAERSANQGERNRRRKLGSLLTAESKQREETR